MPDGTAMSENADSASPTVLITGTSTGIGAACAMDLDRRGWRVFAGVRSEADADRLRNEATGPLTPVLIDVTDRASIGAAAETIREAVGGRGLDGLVNNAGIIVPGPLELLPCDRLRRQFDVNVLGHLNVIQAMLPLLRAGNGRIVNMGSIAGRIAPPYMGAYAASKHALEAITDALRVELRNWGIHVSIVEPDSVATPIWEKMAADAEQLGEHVPGAVRKLYQRDLMQLREATRRMDESGMPVEKVVCAVRHALCARRPKTRYTLGWRARIGPWFFGGIPDRIRDWFVMRGMGIRR